MFKWRGRGIIRIGPKYQLRQRSIVWAWLRPHRGGDAPYRRRCVVLSTDSDIASGKPIRVIGVTTQYDPSGSGLYVSMPYRTGGHPETTFGEPCAARVDWTDVFPENELDHAGGHLPHAEFLALLAAIEAWTRKTG